MIYLSQKVYMSKSELMQKITCMSCGAKSLNMSVLHLQRVCKGDLHQLLVSELLLGGLNNVFKDQIFVQIQVIGQI